MFNMLDGTMVQALAQCSRGTACDANQQLQMFSKGGSTCSPWGPMLGWVLMGEVLHHCLW